VRQRWHTCPGQRYDTVGRGGDVELGPETRLGFTVSLRDAGRIDPKCLHRRFDWCPGFCAGGHGKLDRRLQRSVLALHRLFFGNGMSNVASVAVFLCSGISLKRTELSGVGESETKLGRRMLRMKESRCAGWVKLVMLRTTLIFRMRIGLRERVRSFCRGASGATASEYAVILALMILVVMVSINVLGMSMTGSFTNVGGNLTVLSGGGGPTSGGGGFTSEGRKP